MINLSETPFAFQVWFKKNRFSEFELARLGQLFLDICEYQSHREPGPGKIRSQNTAYAEFILNYIYACDECASEIESYWAERWSEYHSGLF